MRLNSKLNDLNADVLAFNEFLQRKLHPEQNQRLDLADFDDTDLMAIYQCITSNSYSSTKHGHIFLNDPLPKNCRYATGTNRPLCNVKFRDGGYTTVFISAVVLFFKPTQCYTLLPNGQPCGKRHISVHDYCLHHPTFIPHEVHISHLCHHSMCINRKHLIMEPSSANLRRNVCRRDCVCRNTPKCYTDMQ